MATKGKTWRFNVIRQDASRRASTPSTGTIYAGMVVRAPKGLAKPTLFNVGDTQGIKGMIGEGGANWPDIDELLTLNNEFPVLVSAPAGNGSLYGGAHVTKYGIFHFYDVEDPTVDNYKVKPSHKELEEIFDFKFTYTAAKASSGETTEVSKDKLIIEVPNEYSDLVSDILVKGNPIDVKADDDGNYTIEDIFKQDEVDVILDLEEDTYYSVYQNSPTEKEGVLTISDQGLNKYVTDESLVAVRALPTGKLDGLEYLYLAVKDGSNKKGVYQYNEVEGKYSTLANENINTRSFRVSDAYNGSTYFSKDNSKATFDAALKGCIDKIYMIYNEDVDECEVAEVTEDGLKYVNADVVCKDYTLKDFVNKDFNTTTIQLTEKLNDGSDFATNSIKFSLDEEGVDQFGNNIYLDSVLSEDDKTIVLAKVRKTFDDDLNVSGFYTGNLNTGVNTITISGKRLMTAVMNKNLKARKTGGEYNVEYSAILNQGLTEFYDPEMDICSIIVEPTGCATLKSTIKSVAQKNDLAVVVTQKLISDQDVNNLSRISADCRVSNVAEYVGQFQTRDPNTHKSYWVCPIGSVALMLMRIIADKEGAYAPMWNNDGRYGGELSDRTYIKARYKWTDDDTQILDKKGINPLKMTENGVMMLSQRTTMSLNESLHYCRLMYVMAFNKCIRELRDDVAHVMIGKKINLKNPYWLNVAQSTTNKILARRLTGDDPAWESAEGDCISFNNADTLADERFVFKVVVVPATGIEKVTLYFKNQNGGTTITWD